MINYGLPQEIEIDGKLYPINKKGDYRVILDIFSVLNDEKLTERQKATVALNIFYDFNAPDNRQAAIDKMLEFINMGEDKKSEEKPESKSVMDWEQDFPLYIAPLNKALGYETRSPNVYTHWYTFLSGYMEIDGKSTFSTVVQIRQKLRDGKKLDEADREFYNKNRDLVDLKNRLSSADKDWLYGGDNE